MFSCRSTRFLFVVQVCLFAPSLMAQTNVTSYQGRLESNGLPANGTFDFVFRLCSSPGPGGVLQTFPPAGIVAISVVNGLFTQELTFNDAHFTGADRWLEIEVEGVVLSARQHITSTPYAVRALRPGHSLDASDGSPTNALFLDNAGKVGIGTLTPSEELTIAGDTALSVSGQYKGINGALGFLTDIGLGQSGARLESTSHLDLTFDTNNDESGVTPATLRISANGASRQTSDTLVILTDEGNMNIGATNFDPDHRLEVGGVSHPSFSPIDPVTEVEIFHYLQDDVAPAGFNGAATTLRFNTLIDFPTPAARTRTEAFITTEGNTDGSQLFRLVADSANTAMTFENFSGEAMRIDANRRLGLGTKTPDSTLHVFKGTAGTVTAVGNSVATFENSTNGYLTLLVPDANECGVLFGQPVSNVAGGVIYNNVSTPDGLQFRTNGNTPRMVIDSVGRVGIGTLAPATTLDVENGGVVANLNRTGTDGVILNFQNDGTSVGSVSLAGGVVSYNAFSGAHYAWSSESLKRGTLVSMTGDNRKLNARGDSEAVYGVQETFTANDPACLGAFVGTLEQDLPFGAENPLLINAVGNGELCIVDSGVGDVFPGDFLISADIAGCVMKDDPTRFPVGYVIARATEKIIWPGMERMMGEMVKKRTVSVLFGTMVRDGDAASWKRHVEQQQREIDTLRSRLLTLEKVILQDRLSR